MKAIQFIRQAAYRSLVSFLVAPLRTARLPLSDRETPVLPNASSAGQRPSASPSPPSSTNRPLQPGPAAIGAPRAPAGVERDRLPSMLQAGDVILVAGHSRFSSLVCRLTRSDWSHVAIYVGAGHHPDPSYCIVEADVEAGVRMITLERLANHPIHVVRARGLPDASRRELVDYLLARVGLPYDLNHVIDLARLILFAPSPLSRWLGPRTMRAADPTRAVCSTLVAHALFTAGVTVGVSPVLAERLPCSHCQSEADRQAALDYLVPGDFERLPEFVSVFDSRAR